MGLCMKDQFEFYGSVHERSVVILWALSMGGQLKFYGHCPWEVSCSSVGLCMRGWLKFYGSVHERSVGVLWVCA